MKRSDAVTLAILAGAGLVAYNISTSKPSQDDALVYGSEQECVNDHKRTPDECHADIEAAKTAYANAAPRFQNLKDCESEHGAASCQSAESVMGPSGANFFVPLAAAYMISRTAGQGLAPQPVFRQRDETGQAAGAASSSSSRTYWTGSGSSISVRGNDSTTRLSSDVARQAPSSPRYVPRGGFGSTGHAISARSSFGS